jgi:enoyl-CoA hydratase
MKIPLTPKSQNGEGLVLKTDNFKVEKEGHIVWLTLNRPEKRNTMGASFFKEIGELFEGFDSDPEVWVIVIKAEGKSFSAGTDLSEAGALLSGTAADEREKTRLKIIELQEGFNKIEKCRKPVIAAIHSHCIGGGVDLISACDIRIASRDAVFSIREARVGIIADVGTLQRIPYIIGHGWLRELALTGRDFGAQEALQMGLITRICDDREALYGEGQKLAHQIVSCPPMAVQGTKEVLLYSRDHGVYPGLQYVAQKNAAVLPAEDVLEAVSAFMEQREPIFKGR